MRVETSIPAVCAVNNKTMLISCHKFVVKEFVPDFLHELTTAVRQNSGLLAAGDNHIMDAVGYLKRCGIGMR
jgi:hypothetical protein